MIKRLNSMAKNAKNKDFLDQIYYAIGNIYLAQNDTMHAVWSYRDGAEKVLETELKRCCTSALRPVVLGYGRVCKGPGMLFAGYRTSR